jgi:hypothetical protein
VWKAVELALSGKTVPLSAEIRHICDGRTAFELLLESGKRKKFVRARFHAHTFRFPLPAFVEVILVFPPLMPARRDYALLS